MDLLKKELAPVSAQAWAEIEDTAREALRNSLSARHIVDIDGPHGVNYTSASSGRLHVPKNQQSDGVLYGTYQIQPLVETRISFSLSTWELDNIERGARDADLEPVIQAAKKIAQFEEDAVFTGFKEGNITGINQIVKAKEISAVLEGASITDAVSEALNRLRKEGLDPTANLIVSPKVWTFISRPTPGGSLRSLIERQISGSVSLSENVEGAVLAASRGGDMVLTIGQDFSIGYHSHTNTEINLFFMESFTFIVHTPEALVGIKVQ